uniref:Uncharacterized protein n=1 Tax=Nitrosopumivirus cobalaminus TaxID=3158414 RepID=A0AAU7N612_9VIRU
MNEILKKAEFTTIMFAGIGATFMAIILLGIAVPDYFTQHAHLQDLYGSMSTLFIGAVGALLGIIGLRGKLKQQEVSK